MKILPVILSGGTGTRLWPLSRSGYPKQLQSLCGKDSLLQQTAKRLVKQADVLPPVIICNAEQRFLVAEQMREIGIKPTLIVLEPVGRSTAPALAIPALWAEGQEETVMVAMPSDHAIKEPERFAEIIRSATAFARQGTLMTLGLTPEYPHTGYGYIEKGEPLNKEETAFRVANFKEKPGKETAEEYVKSGRYFWNAGVFVFHTQSYLKALERLAPEVLSASREAYRKAERDLDFFVLDDEAFSRSPNISVDYAVMEKADNVGVVPASFGWSDVGCWSALWDIGEKDEKGNVHLGDVLMQETEGCYVRSAGHLIATYGVKDLVIVDTADALLVIDRKRTEEVQKIVAQLKKEERIETQFHKRVWRPWGFYEMLDHGDRFQVKRIVVKPGGKLSLQLHRHRAEHWTVVVGTALATCGEEMKRLGPDESLYIPLGAKHQLENPGETPLQLIEVQTGDYLGEDDIIRFEDVYGRV